MDDQERIIYFLKVTGPVLPAQVAKNINTNILLASAHLSELSSQGKVKLSRLKIGGSPLYYLPEQKEKLQNFVHNLDSKDQETFHQLKEKKILREKNLDLLTRVSLRGIKDFAQPLNLNINQNRELFWKWYLLTDEQAISLIKSQLSPPPQPETKPPSEIKPTPEPIKEPPETEAKEEPSAEPRPKKPLFQKLKEKFKPQRRELLDQLFPQVESFCQEKNIRIESRETVRKNAEMNFILKVPSVVGKLTYFCKAKNKKRCDEKDLSAAYMEAQAKKLPLLFLYTTEISKKAQAMLDSGAFENAMVKKLD